MSCNDRSRTASLLGGEALGRLSRATVFVAGLGGVGGYALELLARAGVGGFVIADGDAVEASNCNRQLIATAETIGMSKTSCWSRRLKSIYSDIRVREIPEFLNGGNIPGHLDAAPVDCILDAIDDVNGKAALLAEAAARKLPAVSSMGAGRRDTLVWPVTADLSRTRNCPLARALRIRLKKNYGITGGIRCVFADAPPDADANSDGSIGSLSVIPAAFGCALAAEVLRILLDHR